jgi:hypothetical protein
VSRISSKSEAKHFSPNLVVKFVVGIFTCVCSFNGLANIVDGYKIYPALLMPLTIAIVELHNDKNKWSAKEFIPFASSLLVILVSFIVIIIDIPIISKFISDDLSSKIASILAIVCMVLALVSYFWLLLLDKKK